MCQFRIGHMALSVTIMCMCFQYQRSWVITADKDYPVWLRVEVMDAVITIHSARCSVAGLGGLILELAAGSDPRSALQGCS